MRVQRMETKLRETEWLGLERGWNDPEGAEIRGSRAGNLVYKSEAYWRAREDSNL